MTTSATGERRGFTLVEILVVITLITLLMTALVAATLNVGQRAYVSSTQILFERIDMSVDRYKDLSGFYPADGLDAPVTSREGKGIMASACLYEFVGRPLVIVKEGPGGKPVVERYDSPVMRGLKQAEIARPPDATADIGEIVDAWQMPIHYDRLEGEGSFSPQSTPDIHLVPPEYHPVDPREVAGVAVTEAGRGQNLGKYDVWSHGRPGHDKPEGDENEKTALKQTLGNWKPPKE
jgi:prepilin-type N-terminal cleavage/methylation domain-containing protein